MSDKENRETFFRRLEPCFARSTLLDFQLAYILSKYGHRAQSRKELDEDGKTVRYFEHPRRVTLIMLDEVKVFERVLVIAALLHDGFEDTHELTPELIERCFGEDVTRVVKILSKVPKEGYHERLESTVDWRPLFIKACDRLDNLRSLKGCDDDFTMKQVDETWGRYGSVFRNLIELAPPYYKRHVEKLVQLVNDECVANRIRVLKLG